MKFGRWTATGTRIIYTLPSGRKIPKVLCVCDCGTEKYVFLSNLTRGLTNSCGCLVKEVSSETHSVHNMVDSPEYKSWSHIKSRCYKKDDPCYHNYGGRGIVMEPEWVDNFQKFLDHIGRKPSAKYSVERINNSLGYIRGNVVWAKSKEQNRNRRISLFTEYKGKIVNLAVVAEETGVSYNTLRYRIEQGMNVYDAISHPKGNKIMPSLTPSPLVRGDELDKSKEVIIG